VAFSVGALLATTSADYDSVSEHEIAQDSYTKFARSAKRESGGGTSPFKI
jgi:hypothetical protein